MSVWSVARDTVARELYSTLCLYGTGYPPAWEDLDNAIREAWAQVADKATDLARGEHGANVGSPAADDFRLFGVATGSATIDDFGDKADRSVSVSVSKTAQGPKFAVYAHVVGTAPDDQSATPTAIVKVVPVDSRGRFDFDDAVEHAFKRGDKPTAKAPLILSLYDLLGCEETGESGALASVAVALNVGDEVVVEVTTKAAGVAAAVEDTHARAFLTGET